MRDPFLKLDVCLYENTLDVRQLTLNLSLAEVKFVAVEPV